MIMKISKAKGLFNWTFMFILKINNNTNKKPATWQKDNNFNDTQANRLINQKNTCLFA